MSIRLISAVCVALVFISPSWAETLVVDVGFDRWMYPFNASPGARVSGSNFGAIANPAFDDLDAQIILGFPTSSAGIPAGAGESSYLITSATLELTTATDAAFVLDPTYDAYSTYLDESSDADPGRPIELYGLGFRNGFTTAGFSSVEAGPPVFEEGEAFGNPGPPAPETRHAFASDFDGGASRDVSNHVRNGFEAATWAIGNVADLAPGSPVPVNTAVQFAIDVTNPTVLAQLQAGMDAGGLFFVVASKHASTQGSSEGIPSFHLGDANGASLGARAQLHLDYQLVPEPSALTLWAVGLLFVTHMRRRSN